jgi:hypothetical protein
MYLLSEDGLAQWPRGKKLDVPPIWVPWGGGKSKLPERGERSLTEDELIDDEIKRGASVNDLTNRVFSNRHPELRDCRLPRSCQELERLQREWALIRAKVATKKDQGGRKKSAKP